MTVAEVMRFHEVATIFPMMGDEEYRALVDNIRAKGLLEPIWVYQGEIIDGRNRYNACLETGVEPRFREWNGNGSLVEFVVSLNLHRRHLTSSQRAMIGTDVEERLAKEAEEKERQRKTTLEIFPKSDLKPIHAAEQAASIVGTNHHYITDAKRIVEQAPELKEPILNGTLTIPEAKRQLGAPAALLSSESNEWYTPAEYIEAARRLMGGIDIDPDSCDLANETVKADTIYHIQDSGLDHDWPGSVWLKPPYGLTDGESNQSIWTSRLIKQYEEGPTTEAVLLVNSATEAKWFQPLYKYLICFTDHRIRFNNSQGESSQPTQGNALVYFGKQRKRFIEQFRRFGRILEEAKVKDE